MRCAPRTRKPTAGICWRPLMGATTKWAWRRLSLAEEGLSAGKKKDATQQASRAKGLLLKNSAAYSRAEEIQREAEKIENSQLTAPAFCRPPSCRSLRRNDVPPVFLRPWRWPARWSPPAPPPAGRSRRYHARPARGHRGDHPRLPDAESRRADRGAARRRGQTEPRGRRQGREGSQRAAQRNFRRPGHPGRRESAGRCDDRRVLRLPLPLLQAGAAGAAEAC